MKKRYEVNSGIPHTLPVDFHRPPTLQEQVRRMIRSERLAQQAAELGYETFEEAEDLDIPEDDMRTPYELEFDPELGKEVLPAQKAELDRARAEFDREIMLRRKKAAAKAAAKKAKKTEPKDEPKDEPSEDE